MLFLNNGNSLIIGKLREMLREESVGSRFLGGWRREWAQIATFCESTNEKFVSLLVLPNNELVKLADQVSGVAWREKSFGQRLKFGLLGGNLCLWGPERFFSFV